MASRSKTPINPDEISTVTTKANPPERWGVNRRHRRRSMCQIPLPTVWYSHLISRRVPPKVPPSHASPYKDSVRYFCSESWSQFLGYSVHITSMDNGMRTSRQARYVASMRIHSRGVGSVYFDSHSNKRRLSVGFAGAKSVSRGFI